MSEPIVPDGADAIRRELIREGLASICEEMAVSVIRTSHSETVKSAMDFSTALCDAKGEIIAQGVTLPNQLGALPDAVAAVLREFGGTLVPGDVVMVNDPFAGGMHLPDIFVVKPVFLGDRLMGIVATVAHHADLGGMVPGSMSPYAEECFQEGLRIPPVRLYAGGVPEQGVFALLRANTRVPEIVLGDMAAQLVACDTGEVGLLRLIEHHGEEVFDAQVKRLLDYTEELTRREIRTFPEGTYRFTDYLDDDGVHPGRVAIAVAVTVADGSVTMDFEGSSPQVKASLNSTLSFTKSNAYAAMRTLLRSDIPNNAGFFRPIAVTAPLGSIVNCVLPAATGTRGLTGFRVLDAVFGALTEAVPDRVMGASDGGLSLVTIGGVRPSGERFSVVELLSGAWGGQADHEGQDGVPNLGANVSNIPVEMLEAAVPVRVDRYGYVPDTGGAGLHRGGMSVEREYTFLGEGVLSVRADREAILPYGIGAGRPGTSSANLLTTGGEEHVMPSKFSRPVIAGDRFYHRTAGAGGWGDPLERDAAAVAGDVRNGILSARRAFEAYGVVIAADGRTLEAAATASERTARLIGSAGWTQPIGSDIPGGAHAATAVSFDVVIRGGRLIDGSGAPSIVGDVGIDGGRIAAVGDLGGSGGDARSEVDARGLAVAPGFIDVHSHGDVTIVADPRAQSAVAQGVTTIVVGNCGHSPAPLPIPAALPELTFGSMEGAPATWTTFAEYLGSVEASRPAINVASLVGHNALRVAALGHSPREGTGAEFRAMGAELEQAMEAGAYGLSSGLEYPLGARSTTDELILLAATAGRLGGLFALHTRDRDFRAVEAFDEAFAIAERSGAPLQISHIAPRRGAPDGALVDVLARIDRARAGGLDISCDQHTRLHGITKLTTMLPPSASAVGTDELLRQLRDPKARTSFHEFREPIHKLGLLGEWDRLALFEARESPEWVGKDFATIGRERGQHPLDAMMDILLEAGDDAPNVLFVGLVQTQEDLDLTFASSTCSPESDATTLSLDGPLANQRFLGAYTWAASYLGRIVRERHVLGLEEGVRRLTRVPAERVGLADRGTLVPGAWADITIFDPEVVEERGTVAAPNAFPVGIHHVYVNGELAFRDGRFAAARRGQVLRRPGRGIAV